MVPLKYNTRNLIVRRITSLLVVVIFSLVLFILVVLLAFVEGLNARGMHAPSGQPWTAESFEIEIARMGAQ